MKRLIPILCASMLTLSACQSKAKVDPEIMADLEAIVSNCKVGVSGNTVNKCKNKEHKALLKKFSEKKKDKVDALDTFSVALTSENKELAVAASTILYSGFRNFGTTPKKVSKDVAKRLIEAVAKSPKYQAAQALTAAVHAANLAGEQEALYAMLENHPYDSLPGLAYPKIMYYGRMNAFPKVKSLVDSGNKKWAKAALKAPRNMPKPTEEEKAAVCSWADSKIKGNTSDTFYGVGNLMIWCKGEYINTLLTEGEKRLEKNIFTRNDYLLFRDVCFTPIKGLIKEAGKEAQCKRTLTFLEKAVNNESLESLPRGLALFAIYYQRRNADSMVIMKKYKDHKDPKIQKYAKESIESLVKHYKVAE